MGCLVPDHLERKVVNAEGGTYPLMMMLNGSDSYGGPRVSKKLNAGSTDLPHQTCAGRGGSRCS